MADEKSREGRGLMINVDVDVSDGIKGLKALQREAKETIKVLKELESIMPGQPPIIIDSIELAKKIVDDIPEHVKRYGEGGKGWSSKGERAQSWFGTK